MLALLMPRDHGIQKAYFMICRLCFWCASVFSIRSVDKCPACGSPMVEHMPIFPNETYTFDRALQGTVLRFSTLT